MQEVGYKETGRNGGQKQWKQCGVEILRQGKFIYKAQFVHKTIQSALQLYKIRRRQIKSFHKKIK